MPVPVSVIPATLELVVSRIATPVGKPWMAPSRTITPERPVASIPTLSGAPVPPSV